MSEHCKHPIDRCQPVQGFESLTRCNRCGMVKQAGSKWRLMRPEEDTPRAGSFAHPPPKQIAMRFCPNCAFSEYAHDVNREDAIEPAPCNECAQPTVVCFYSYDRTMVPR